jgi:apoptosis-inducing factor 2
MANAIRKLFYYGITEHLQLLLRLFNVVLIHLSQDDNKKQAAGGASDVSSRTIVRHRVVIVGASFAGCKVEQILSKYHPDHFEITWIDEKAYFEYIPGSLRCLVEPDHFKRISCKLAEIVAGIAQKDDDSSSSTTTTQFIQGRVVDVPSATTLRLADGQDVLFDSLVLCAGSTYNACPIIKTSTITTALDRLASYNAEARQIRAAHTIIIVGAGAVGIELAGELLMLRRHNAHLRRSRKIIVLDLADTILPGFPTATIHYATEYLQKRSVELRLSTKIKEIGEKQIVLADGTVLAADLIYQCVGAAPNTNFLQQGILKNALTGPKQALAVNDQLQVIGFSHIYAAGDLMHHPASDEIKLGHTAEVNGTFIAESIIAKIVHGGKAPNASSEQQRTYPQDVVGNVATPFIYCISLGQYDGTLGFNGLVINGFIAALMKWLIEWTKVAAVKKQPIGILFWQVGDAVSNWLGRTVLPTKAKKD